MSRLFEEFSLCLCFIPDNNTPSLASISVTAPQTANTTAGVQVEHTEVKKHYNTLTGYCDHHEPMPPRTRSNEDVCVCVSVRARYTALLWQKFHRACASVCESVFLCVLILFSTGMEVSLAKRSPLLSLSSLALCVWGKLTDRQTDGTHAMHSLLFSLPINLKYFLKMKTPLQIITVITIVMDRFSFS